ncbi:unnamed protein product [Mytilus coruscus]|uniref:Immunoglobulin domain-containing protein n=1 Tax=Mytilus coruscus TaxID=42192 RepID=A0A6J8C9B5_MYTCO|nr:unnamed protein product [Mytilus coruscus]
MVYMFVLILLLLHDESIVADYNTTVYTAAGSTILFKFEIINEKTECVFARNSKIFKSIGRDNTGKYCIQVSKQSLDLQINNVTASDNGVYRMVFSEFDHDPTLELKSDILLTDWYNTSRASKPVCPIEESSTTLTFMFDTNVYSGNNKVDIVRRRNIRKMSNFNVELTIYNVTQEDEGIYQCFPFFDHDGVLLEVAKLWFKNQTGTNTIVGQEGTPMEINCSTDTEQYISTLKLESNGSIRAIGNNHTVSYSFIPDRTDHMTKYKCVDSTQSSIMIEVTLIIRYAPAVTVRCSNETIECDSDGFPAVYSVYRLDQVSKRGNIVRSINLNNKALMSHTFLFPYQRNGMYICSVSNGIPDSNGTILQNRTTNVKYKGPPVFSAENIMVIKGEVGQSITLSFYIYSYPDVEEVVIEKIGRKQSSNTKIKHYSILTSTLRYTEFDNIAGIEGYEILIERKVLEIDDFQTYRITAKNHLGKSNYNFEIIDIGNLMLSKGKRRHFVILCSIATVLFVYMIITHVFVCVRHKKTRDQRNHNVPEDHNHHAYDEIGTMSSRSFSNLRSADTFRNQGQNLTNQADISTSAILQSTDDDTTTELNANFSADGLHQREITELQDQRMSISSNESIISNTVLSRIPSTAVTRMENILNCNQTYDSTYIETSMSQPGDESDSETSNNVTVGNVGDGYENPYQMVLQDRPQSHPYIVITVERRNSLSSTESKANEEQRPETG